MNQCTKGEWKAWVNEIHLNGEPTISNRIALTFQQSFMDTGEAQANARLMAASPRMIKFIQKLASEGNKEAAFFIQTIDLS